MTFTFRQLEIFVEAAADENFRITAERLGISQPSVSNHITALENKAGGQLFERRRGSAARLSPFGRDMLDQARMLLRESRKMPDHGQRQDPSYTLRVAAGAYLVDYCIRPSLAQYYAAGNLPNIELIPAFPGNEMVSLLRSGRVDLACYTGRPISFPDVDCEVLRRVSVGLYGTPALVAPLEADIARISAAPIIMLPVSAPANDWMLNTLTNAGIYPRLVAARAQFVDVLTELVVQGVGLGLLFDEEGLPLAEAGRLVRLPLEFDPGFRVMLTRRGFRDPRAKGAVAHVRNALLSPSRRAD
ncbi:LysR family transcriptional regulator [Novosphingobium sp. FSY-8]|uniref:LysR family transcriptional regulator n=1 Tax=Novosphingobium ovatum TaxID=1908523 RepID=A0ABW9XFY6_9SPHN|nr:LysR family transcriptional regulator [Novosphingobium ovatum]NBC37426.1 LysR family transcriptional regulator [Novosphingobium ovatum]